MSHLELPRLHFRGDFVADVFTCNNDDIASAFPTQQFVDSASVTVDTLGMDDATFKTWLRQFASPFGIRAGWNLYGTGACYFENAKVHGAQAVGGALVSDPAADRIVGGAVDLNEAVMVDLDPEGTLGTQIFANELSIRRSATMRMVGRPGRMFSRFVTRRNLGASGFAAFAASWYAAIPAEQLSVQADTSTTLASFEQARQNGDGLYLAFCIYLMAPVISQTQLASDFAAGLETSNPARGKVMGTIGTWKTTEMKSVPTGRRMVAGASLLHDHSSFQLNPATVCVDTVRQVVSLDLMNTFPELNTSLDKVDIGEVHLAAVKSGPKGPIITDIGSVPYNREAYERQSGMIDVPYDSALASAVQDQQLVLVQESTQAIVLAELSMTVESDQRCIYLQEGAATDATIWLTVKGAAPTASQSVAIQQFVTSNRTQSPANATNAVVTIPGTITIGSSGQATLHILATRPGTCLISMALPGEAPLTSFINVRVLPLDNYDAVLDEDLTFEFVYQEVLRYYALLFPVMRPYVDFSSEASVRLSASAILDRIAADQFDLASYMPVSRDLSDGKRKLLQRWLTRPTAGP